VEFWLTTDRLALERFSATDLDWLAALHADPDVMRHVGGPHSREQVSAVLENRILGYYDEHPGLGTWKTIERSTGAPIGLHLLNNIQGETLMQVGYFLHKNAWGKGYGTEMARALVRYGFVDLKLPQITAMTGLDNLASQRVLLKSGLRRNGTRAFTHPAYAAHGPQAWFERDAREWLAEQSL
jgi:ribosomal-protein-alanine N-acetyltransferase